MNFKKLELNFKEIKTLNDMHSMLKERFGFPDFYGNNVNALIDCLSSLRYPDHEMSDFLLDSTDDVLIIELKNFSTCENIVVNHFLTAIMGTNNKDRETNNSPSIYLSL
ncbi:barstar family protein [Tenacibaculum dicentrarchi]|uniref:barstar family protein n=1 Tax=Tenacibaculum dicentrarchi TaxID=669041 RepID=UPI0035136A62